MQDIHEKRGFTLIELSIVLVIIGLIIGGVLVGRDMIESAKIRMQITQIEKVNAAANAFRNKFNSIPGDLSNTRATDMGFTAVAHATNPQLAENRLLDGDAFTAMESWAFFKNLAEAKLYNCTSCVLSYDNGGANATWDAVYTFAVVNHNNILIPYGGAAIASPNGGATQNYTKNYIEIAHPAASANLSMKPVQAYALDAKVDDGLPLTGKVIPANSYVLTGWPDIWRANRAASTGATGSANCVSTDTTPNTYNTQTTAMVCDLRFDAQF